MKHTKNIIFDFCYMEIFIPRILICFESFVMLSTQEPSYKKLFKHQIGLTFFSLYYMYARLITSLRVHTKKGYFYSDH